MGMACVLVCGGVGDAEVWDETREGKDVWECCGGKWREVEVRGVAVNRGRGGEVLWKEGGIGGGVRRIVKYRKLVVHGGITWGEVEWVGGVLLRTFVGGMLMRRAGGGWVGERGGGVGAGGK
ncbi:hypothetical protein Tco_0553473 [Tanacetum coccineum]